jgi:electron transfer flavoprotein alpha subunit
LVAGVLVYIEREGDNPLRSSFEALGEGRRIASTLGAPLTAFAPGLTASTALAEELAAYGADKVILMAGPDFVDPPTWASHGAALHRVCELSRPLLVLLSGTPAGRDLAPRLAARLDAAFIVEPSIECGPRGEVVYTRTLYGAAYLRRLSADDLRHAVVATLTPGTFATAAGNSQDAEILKLDPPLASEARCEEISSENDADAALESAAIVVTAGAGVTSAADMALVADLAQALGGELGGTRAVCERGLIAPGREIGIGARHVAPRLYVACGASGSAAHLGAVAQDAAIVAIDRNPDAPIFRQATYGLVGAIADVVPELIAEIRATRRADS